MFTRHHDATRVEETLLLCLQMSEPFDDTVVSRVGGVCNVEHFVDISER